MSGPVFSLFRLRLIILPYWFCGLTSLKRAHGGRKQNWQLSSKLSVSAAPICLCYRCNIEAEGVIGNIRRPHSNGNSTCGTSVQCLSVCENVTAMKNTPELTVEWTFSHHEAREEGPCH